MVALEAARVVLADIPVGVLAGEAAGGVHGDFTACFTCFLIGDVARDRNARSGGGRWPVVAALLCRPPALDVGSGVTILEVVALGLVLGGFAVARRCDYEL